MPLDRPVVFPLLPISSTGACTCAKGLACSRVGKHPAVLWKEIEEGGEVPLPAPNAGFGIKTGARPRGSDLVVVDLDGDKAVDAWNQLGGAEDTYTVSTGRGLHLYFRHPGFYCGNTKSALGPKIDTRGDGGFVVGPGSPHISGTPYVVVDDREPAPLPAWLVDWFKRQPGKAEAQPHPEDVTGPERDRRRQIYGTWLATEAPPCVAGQGGDETLFKVVQKGAYDLALPSEDVLELIVEHYDPRCDPPWGDELDERVLHKCNSAKNTSRRERIPPPTAEEEAMYADVGIFDPATPPPPIEPTRLVDPAAEKEAVEIGNDYGFKIQWGGWDDTPQPPNYIVDNLLVQEKVSMIFAEPGTIKSWTAIDIAACVSQGLPWLGERAVSQGKVLYVDFEDGKYEFHRRVHLLSGHENRPGLGYVYAPGNISEKEWWVRLEKVVLAHDIKFVVIDTLAGATPGIDENDRNAADPLTYAGWFTETARATVLILHHANKAGDIRGTSAFKATVDTLFKLETVEDENGVHKAKLTCVKSGQKKVYPIHLEFTDDGLRRYEPPVEPEDDGDEKRDKRTLDELQAEVLLLIESQGPFSSIEKIRTLVRARTSNVNAVLAELQGSGEVYKSPEGWRRDNESLRRYRLKGAVERHPDGVRGKLLAESFVSKDFFEQCRREGRLRPAIVGDESSGFIWVEI